MIEVVHISEVPTDVRFKMHDELKVKSGNWVVLWNYEVYDRFNLKPDAESCASDLAAWFS